MILLHGTCEDEEYFSDKYPSLSNSHWFPWLQKQLLMRGILTQTPEMPEANKPDYGKWKGEFESLKVDDETILVGHSCGGGFLVRWLSENKLKVDKLVLVAPWLDPERRRTTDFFDFEIDGEMQKRIKEIAVFVSGDDEADVLKSVETIRKVLTEARVYSFGDKGHFTYNDMGTDKFPELLEVILGK